jgi:hypothetical protein
METDIYKTKAVFRKWPDGDIIALFPEEAGDVYGIHCASYMHIGQHANADYESVVGCTTLATPSEYADLQSELASMDYNLQIMKRCNPQAYQIRKEAAKRRNEL